MATLSPAPPQTRADDAALPTGRVRPALAGVLAAIAALAAGELAAGLVPGGRSPVVVVGDAVIDLVPGPVKDLAIALFGTADKIALITGILVLLVLFAAAVGVVGARHRARGIVGIAALGLVGAAAATANAQGSPAAAAAAPSLVATVAGVAALVVLLRALPGPASGPPPPSEPRPARALDRRAFLRTGGAVAGLAVVAVSGGRWLQQRASAAASRATTMLRPADVGLSPLTRAVEVDVDGMIPFVTPNRDFYRIDTALQVPQVPVDTWSMRVTGMVDRELEFTFADLMDRELVEADITLSCVSNQVGGGLIGNARWLGVRLDEVLREAGVDPAADQVVGRSVDGFAVGFPTTVALDGRDALIAVGMNGEPLPLEHGFPARLVVPGLYGYVSATKWLAEIELTTFADFDHYWLQRGWAREAPIKTQSRIDVPRASAAVEPGPTALAGVAWAPHRGVERVEVQVDDGDWRDADLAEVPGVDTWRQWSLEWEAAPGSHQVRVRATDATGQTQPEERVDPVPDGATGWHTIQVRVRDGA